MDCFSSGSLPLPAQSCSSLPLLARNGTVGRHHAVVHKSTWIGPCSAIPCKKGQQNNHTPRSETELLPRNPYAAKPAKPLTCGPRSTSSSAASPQSCSPFQIKYAPHKSSVHGSHGANLSISRSCIGHWPPQAPQRRVANYTQPVPRWQAVFNVEQMSPQLKN